MTSTNTINSKVKKSQKESSPTSFKMVMKTSDRTIQMDYAVIIANTDKNLQRHLYTSQQTTEKLYILYKLLHQEYIIVILIEKTKCVVISIG